MCGGVGDRHIITCKCSGWTPWCIYIWLDISAPSISRAWFFRTLGSQSFCFMNVPVKVSSLGELAAAILCGEEGVSTFRQMDFLCHPSLTHEMIHAGAADVVIGATRCNMVTDVV